MFGVRILLCSEKLLDEKIFKASFPIKKIAFIFVAKHPLPFKRDLAPRNDFSPFSRKMQVFFLKKLLNNKIFSTWFVIKKCYVNFWGKTPRAKPLLTLTSTVRNIAILTHFLCQRFLDLCVLEQCSSITFANFFSDEIMYIKCCFFDIQVLQCVRPSCF